MAYLYIFKTDLRGFLLVHFPTGNVYEFWFLRWIGEIKCREVIKWRHTHIHTHTWQVISIYAVKITSQATVAKQTAQTKRFSLAFKREKAANFSQICNLNNETRFAYCIVFCGYI